MSTNLTNSELNDRERKLDEKEQKLNAFYKKFLTEYEKFKQDKNNLEVENEKKLHEYKNELREKNLNEMKIAFAKIDEKQNEIDKIKVNLCEKENELLRKEEFLKQEEIFLSENRKNDLVNHKKEQEIEKQKLINDLEQEKLVRIEEINQQIKNLYKEKEKEYLQKEENLNLEKEHIKELELQLESKIRYAENEEERLRIEFDRKVELEKKSYEDTKRDNEKQLESKDQEIRELRNRLNEYYTNQDIDLTIELKTKCQENLDLNKQKSRLEQECENLKQQADKNIQVLNMEISRLRTQNDELTLQNNQINEIKNENARLTEDNRDIKYWRDQKDIWERRYNDLQNIFSSKNELNIRISAIEQEHYKQESLLQMSTFNKEVEWLENMALGMKEFGVEYPRRLLFAFHTALKSADFSPLVTLAGVSGTGKSELPKLYSYFGGFNFLAESVQPTWDSPESMMGYYNTIENKFDSTNILKFIIQTTKTQALDTPYGWRESMNMILLDEMNLSHIELYFAEFLSKFEQRRGADNISLDIKLGAGMIHRIPLLKNILWVGTMNEDETTKSLSDKVLDRSFCINFPRPEKLKSRNYIKMLHEIKEFEYLPEKVWNSWLQKNPFDSDEYKTSIKNYNEITNEINKKMSNVGRAIGHRVWQSMEYYIQNHPDVISSISDNNKFKERIKIAYEDQLVQKIMPKLRGIETHGDEKKTLDDINDILAQNDLDIQEDFSMAMSNPYGQFIWRSAEYLKGDKRD
jgi:translation initiation factor IF-2, N-terminal domain protein